MRSGPFIFVATNRLKAGRFEGEKRRVPELCEFLEVNQPAFSQSIVAQDDTAYANNDHSPSSASFLIAARVAGIPF